MMMCFGYRALRDLRADADAGTGAREGYLAEVAIRKMLLVAERSEHIGTV